jgi:hypothetical protein
MHGKGKYYYNDETIYEGDWVNGEMHGIGKLYSKKGVISEGKWENG